MNPEPNAPIDDTNHELAEASRPGSDANTAPDIPALAWNKKLWIGLAGLAGLLLGQLAYWKFGPMYESKGEVLVSRNSLQPVKDRDGDAVNVGDRGEHIALILSPLIIDSAVKAGQLDQLPSIKGAPDPSREIIDFLKVRRRAGQDRSVLNVMELTFVCPRRGDGQKVVQSVIDAYRSYLSTARDESKTEAFDTYNSAEKEQEKTLEGLMKEYMAFRESAPLHWKNAPGTQGSTSDLTNVEQEKLTKIDMDRRDVMVKQVEAKSKIETLEAAIAKHEPPEVLEFLVRRMINMHGGAAGDQSRQWESLQSQLVPLFQQEQKLITAGFGKDHYELRTVRKQIEGMKESYRRQGVLLPEDRPVAKRAEGEAAPQSEITTLYVASLKKELMELENRTKALDLLYVETSEKAKEYAALMQKDQQYNDKIKVINEVLAEIRKKRNGVQLSQNTGGYSMKQLAPVSEEIQAKRYIQFLGVGAFFLMACSFGYFYIRASQDNTIKSVDDLRMKFGVQAIGQVPEFDVSQVQVAAGSRLDPSVVYVHHSGSIEAEAYRSIRTSIFFSTQGQGHQVFQVTSAEPSDGKTTLISNLAASIANAGKTVLLIDADLRRPRVHECFGEAQRPGLADVLAGAVRVENAIHATQVPGLSLMCSGNVPANPSEMLGSIAYERVIQKVRQEFDYVLVDSPPMMVVSDPCILSRQSNGMILVFRQGKNRLSVVRHTIDMVRSHGIRLVGAVLNGVDLPEESSYGYSYREQYYLSGSEKKPAREVSIQSGKPLEPIEV